MIDLGWLARAIANMLIGSFGFDPMRVAELGRLLNIEGRIRQQAGAEITAIKKLSLGVPERCVPRYQPANQETDIGQTAQG